MEGPSQVGCTLFLRRPQRAPSLLGHVRTQLEDVPGDSGGGPSPDTDPAGALTLDSLHRCVCRSWGPRAVWSERPRQTRQPAAFQRPRSEPTSDIRVHARSGPRELGSVLPAACRTQPGQSTNSSLEQRSSQLSLDSAPQTCQGRVQELGSGARGLSPSARYRPSYYHPLFSTGL